MRLPFFSNNNERQDLAQPPVQQQPAPFSAPGPAARIPPPSEFPQLATMSVTELENALKDQATYEKLLVRVVAEVRERGGGGSGGGELAALQRDTAALARANLARGGELAELRNQIAIVRTTGYDAARAECEERLARQEKAREQIAPERLIERLRQAAGALKEESAALERRLQSGELGVEEFVQQYVAVRTRHHSLDLKYHAAVQTIPM